MKYTIHGFSQAEAVKLGLNNDDLLILRWFVDFTPSKDIKSCLIKGKPFYWINYHHIIEGLPILQKTEKAISKYNIQRLLNAGVLVREIRLNAPEIEHRSGKTAWFGFGEKYSLLTDDIFLGNQGNKNTLDQGNKSILDQGNKSILDYSNIDSSNINKCVNTGVGVRACAYTHVESVDLSPLKVVLPSLIVDVQTLPSDFDCDKVANAVKQSTKFLSKIPKLSFYVRHYNDIINNYFVDIGKGTTDDGAIVRRNYSKEELSEMFPEIDNFDDLDF